MTTQPLHDFSDAALAAHRHVVIIITELCCAANVQNFLEIGRLWSRVPRRGRQQTPGRLLS